MQGNFADDIEANAPSWVEKDQLGSAFGVALDQDFSGPSEGLGLEAQIDRLGVDPFEALENFVQRAEALCFDGKMGVGVVEATELVEPFEMQSAYHVRRETVEVLVVVEGGK